MKRTPKKRVMGLCSYCGVRRAVNRDHVVPKALSKTHVFQYAFLPEKLKRLVPACFECNTRKGTRRLVPPSWEPLVEMLNEEFPGTPWRVWHGTVEEPAFKDVHV